MIVGTGGELQDSSSLTFSGATLANTLVVQNNATAANLTASQTVTVNT